MPEPVKLNAERWIMLREALTAGVTMQSIVNVTLANRIGQLTVHEPLQCGDVVFLPAEYVPAEPAHEFIQMHVQSGSDCAAVNAQDHDPR